MPVSPNQQRFIGKYLSVAGRVSRQTGVPVDYLLGQMALESAWGTSQAALKDDNLSGINAYGPFKQGVSGYAHYNSLSQYANSYAQVLKSGYSKALQAARDGASAQTYFTDLAKEGYAGLDNMKNPANYAGPVAATVATIDQMYAPQSTSVSATIDQQSINELAQVINQNNGDLTRSLNRIAQILQQQGNGNRGPKHP